MTSLDGQDYEDDVSGNDATGTTPRWVGSWRKRLAKTSRYGLTVMFGNWKPNF
jgi:hypothetical protein